MTPDLVILLHGILRLSAEMIPLARFLGRAGYDTAIISYPSRRHDLETLTEIVAQKIQPHINLHPDKMIHFVAHSMGGLITRYYIARHRPRNLGRVVMLSPPNTGSEAADYLYHHHPLIAGLYRWSFGPAGRQLLTTYRHPDPPLDYPVGIIAGDRSVNPLAGLALPKPHDGIVPVERTRIENMTDHIILPVNHSFMMFDRTVMAQTAAFLKDGRFIRPS